MPSPHCFRLIAGLVLLGTAGVSMAQARPNVLFIAIDDLRNDLGAYGNSGAQTPNLDDFAKAARVFRNHYVQVPTCGASRCALLRGRYPSTAAHLGNGGIAQTHAQWGDANLHAWFQRQGYATYALGKITHYPGGRTGRLWAEGPEELPGAWTRSWIPETPWGAPQNIMHGTANGQPRVKGQTRPLESFDGPDHAYPDAYVADEAERTLLNLSQSRQPWLLAVGFFKPHLPFAAPKRYLDLHPVQSLPARNPGSEKKPAWPSTWHGSGELHGNYTKLGSDGEYLFPEVSLAMRQAYAACVSYVDAQVGRVLAALRKHHLDDNTVIVVWSDHGFLLGEHGIWGKHCLFEKALKSPLMIQYPGMPVSRQSCEAVVETVDIFPTLTDLCNLPVPTGLDGRSLRPHLENPAAPSARAARSWWSNGWRTLRDERWRLVVKSDKQGGPSSVELYDYLTDPDETRNHAAEQPALVQQMLTRLAERPRIPAEKSGKSSPE
jgi:iduronate 2-sulfatase